MAHVDSCVIFFFLEMGRNNTNSKKSNSQHKFNMDENLRLCVQQQIDAFIANDELMEYEFPTSLTNAQRGYIHTYVIEKGLQSKSHGKGMCAIKLIKSRNNKNHISNKKKTCM